MKKIRLGEKEYPCRVTMGAMVRFKQESGRDVSGMSSEDVSDSVLFLYCCIKSAWSEEGEKNGMEGPDLADHQETDVLNGFYAGMESGKKKMPPTA